MTGDGVAIAVFALLLGGCAGAGMPVRDSGAVTGLDAGELDTGDDEPEGDDDDDVPADDDDAPADDDGGGETGRDSGDTDGPGGDDGSGESSGDIDDAPSAVVFLAFDGVTLTQGEDEDATANTVLISEMEGTFSVHDPTRSAAVLEGVQSMLAPYDIEVTALRPPSGDYTMVVVTDDPPFMYGTIGFGLVDCDDQNPNGIVIVYDDPAQDWDLAYIVNAAVFQLGGSYGLNMTDDPTDVMYRYASPDPRQWKSECIAVYSTPVCESAGAACGSGMQSSHEEMLDRFGPA